MKYSGHTNVLCLVWKDHLDYFNSKALVSIISYGVANDFI